MPFITEEIWQALPHSGESIMTSPFPECDRLLVDDVAESEMSAVMDIVRAVRNLRAELGAAPSKIIDMFVTANADAKNVIDRNSQSIKSLARIGELKFIESVCDADRGKYLSAHLPGVDIFIEVIGIIDVEKESARIDLELDAIVKELAQHESKLNNDQFIARAPAAIVEKERGIVAELVGKRSKLLERKQSLTIKF